MSEQLPFIILDETSKSFPKVKATGRSLFIKFNSPVEEQNPCTYLKECITALRNYLVNDVPERDLVGLRIRNTENVEDKVVGISLRRSDQLKPDVVWAVLGKVIQSNAKFGLTDRLEVHLDHVRMPAGNGKRAEKTKGRSLNVLSAIKKSIVTVQATVNCLAYALIIAMARVNGDPKYQLYRHSKSFKKPVEDLLKASGVDVPNGGGFDELRQFQDHVSGYQIIVFHGLSPDTVMFRGNSSSVKKLHLLYDRNIEHYNVITSLKGCGDTVHMYCYTTLYICSGCDTVHMYCYTTLYIYSGCDTVHMYCYTTLYICSGCDTVHMYCYTTLYICSGCDTVHMYCYTTLYQGSDQGLWYM